MRLVLLTLVGLSAVSAHNLLFKGEGEECKNETKPWTCKVASKCTGLKNGIEKDGEVKLCGFSGTEPIICCPPETGFQITDKFVPTLNPQPDPVQRGKKAQQKCKEYAEFVYREVESPVLIEEATKKKIDECAINAETLIVGGTPAKLNEFPHMALIGLQKQGGKPIWFCGGSLISPNYILTAAHCYFPNIRNISDSVIVRLGELDILDGKDRADPIDVKVAQFINHPLYVSSKANHDIALWKLEKEVVLSPEIRPLCLQVNRTVKHEMAIASGWGVTKPSFGKDADFNAVSSILQKVNLTLTNDDECVKIYGKKWPKIQEGIKPDIMMCAGGIRGKDTCQGDSGGPLQVAIKDPYCMYSIIGITAVGVGCGQNIPGVYTRVSAYVPWIESIVWP